jgi:nitrite reductase (NO-forming)
MNIRSPLLSVKRLAMRQTIFLYFILVSSVLITSGCRPHPVDAGSRNGLRTQMDQAALKTDSNSLTSMAFTLQTDIVNGRMVYVGVGGEIDGLVNPDLVIRPGAIVHLTLINKDGVSHDLSIPELGVHTPLISARDATTRVEFTLTKAQTGAYSYFCTVPGHRQAGMAGTVIVADPKQ